MNDFCNLSVRLMLIFADRKPELLNKQPIMNRKIRSMAVCLLTSTTLMHAQTFLSQNHAMKRVKTAEKFVLLPVEENEGLAHIRIIKDRNHDQT